MKRLTTILLLIFAIGICTISAKGETDISFITAMGRLRIVPMNDNAVRILVEPEHPFPLEEIVFTQPTSTPHYKVSRKGDITTVSLKQMRVEYDARTSSLRFTDKKGNTVLAEQTDGRQVKPSALTVSGGGLVDISQAFISPADEYLYGTGQFQDGYLNIRALTRRLTQVNTQIAVPFILSSKGYGLLWHNYGLTDFNPSTHTIPLKPATDTESTTEEVNATSTTGNVRERRTTDTFRQTITLDRDGDYAFLLDVGQSMARKLYLAIDGHAIIDQNNTWLPPTGSARIHLTAGSHNVEVRGTRGDRPTLSWRIDDGTTVLHSPTASALDYTVFVGSPDQVIASYRQLTGPVPAINPALLGYVHCRERYNTQTEIIETAKRFQSEGIPLDVIVQDWQYWGKYGWNAMRFDEDRYPDPAAMTRQLHDMGVQFMLSVWSKVDRNSELGHQIADRGYYIDNTEWVDFFKPAAAAFHWQNFRDRLLRPYDIDIWWFDATEPENDDLVGRHIGADRLPGEIYRNVYPMKVINTMYEGLKADDSPRTPSILTRCAFSGMQRYGAVVWSGDVGNDMDCLRRQIAAGLGYVATGMPWWTYDAGGFFRPGNQYTDAAYQERMIRWIQASVFLPVMRVHGYMSNTEPWNYQPDTYARFVACIKERKALKDYIEQCANRVSTEGYTLMRPLVFDFASDPEALKQDCQYMFGPRYLVCPITAEGVSQWTVYLPQTKGGWTDHYTGRHYDGGQYVTLPVDMEHIVVMERAGY